MNDRPNIFYFLAKKVIALYLLLLLLPAQAMQTQEFTPYLVKKGESISQILHNHNLSPLYGAKEWVEKVLNLNRLDIESATKLRIGDVIVLPLPTHYFSPEEISQNYIPREDLVALMPETPRATNGPFLGRHFVAIGVGNFVRKTNLQQGGQVATYQNLNLSADYKYRDRSVNRPYTVNLVAGATVYGQQESRFEKDPAMHASFTPSYRAFTGAEWEFVKSRTFLTLLSEGEYFSTVDYAADQYEVRKDMALRLGPGFSQTIGFRGVDFTVGARYLKTAIANQKKFQNAQASLNGARYQMEAGLRLFDRYSIKGFYEGYSFSDNSKSIWSTGLNLGMEI